MLESLKWRLGNLFSGAWKDPEGATKELVVEYDVPASSFEELRLDGKTLRLVNGVAKAKVLPGSYSLHARAIGQPDREYAIKITAPPEAKWEPKPPRKCDHLGRVNDYHQVTISGGVA